MIDHVCGKPTVDDGHPDTFVYDEACAECRAIRDETMWRQLQAMLCRPRGVPVPPSASKLLQAMLHEEVEQNYVDGYPTEN